MEHITAAEIGADYGYTVDGETLGEIEDETFCADSLEINISGINVHPGMAKGKMVNAVKIAARIIEKLPKATLSPETTEKREGYVHPHQVSGNVEAATIKFIIRDFTVKGLKKSEKMIEKLAAKVTAQFPGSKAEVKVSESYRNMKVVLDKHPDVLAKAEKAVTMAGLKVDRAQHPRRHRRGQALLHGPAHAQPVHRRPQLPFQAGVDRPRGHEKGLGGHRQPDEGLGHGIKTFPQVRCQFRFPAKNKKIRTGR